MRPAQSFYMQMGQYDFFKSVAEAERYAEPIDVQNLEYVAYDSDGRRLELRVETEVVAGLFGLGKINRERVRIVPAENTASTPKLKSLLRAFLQKLGASPDSLHSATLQDLHSSKRSTNGILLTLRRHRCLGGGHQTEREKPTSAGPSYPFEDQSGAEVSRLPQKSGRKGL